MTLHQTFALNLVWKYRSLVKCRNPTCQACKGIQKLNRPLQIKVFIELGQNLKSYYILKFRLVLVNIVLPFSS